MVSISGGAEGRTTAELGYLLDGMQALITNPALFIEPYVSHMVVLRNLDTDRIPSAASNAAADHVHPALRPARQRTHARIIDDLDVCAAFQGERHAGHADENVRTRLRDLDSA